MSNPTYHLYQLPKRTQEKIKLFLETNNIKGELKYEQMPQSIQKEIQFFHLTKTGEIAGLTSADVARAGKRYEAKSESERRDHAKGSVVSMEMAGSKKPEGDLEKIRINIREAFGFSNE